MAEYVIEVSNKDGEVTHLVVMNGDRKTTSLTIASKSGYEFASKFKVKERAEKIAKKIEGAKAVLSFGGYVNSTKSAVAPINGKVNGKTAFSQTMTAYRKNQY